MSQQGHESPWVQLSSILALYLHIGYYMCYYNCRWLSQQRRYPPSLFQVASKLKTIVQSTHTKRSNVHSMLNTAWTAMCTPTLHHWVVKLNTKQFRKEGVAISSRKHISCVSQTIGYQLQEFQLGVHRKWVNMHLCSRRYWRQHLSPQVKSRLSSLSS